MSFFLHGGVDEVTQYPYPAEPRNSISPFFPRCKIFVRASRRTLRDRPGGVGKRGPRVGVVLCWILRQVVARVVSCQPLLRGRTHRRASPFRCFLAASDPGEVSLREFRRLPFFPRIGREGRLLSDDGVRVGFTECTEIGGGETEYASGGTVGRLCLYAPYNPCFDGLFRPDNEGTLGSSGYTELVVCDLVPRSSAQPPKLSRAVRPRKSRLSVVKLSQFSSASSDLRGIFVRSPASITMEGGGVDVNGGFRWSRRLMT